jgi:hypothetical protein
MLGKGTSGLVVDAVKGGHYVMLDHLPAGFEKKHL